MESTKKVHRVPEFLSTHPAGKKRIEDIEKLLPEANAVLSEMRLPAK